MSHKSCFLQVTGDSRKASTETSWKLWPPSETLVEFRHALLVFLNCVVCVKGYMRWIFVARWSEVLLLAFDLWSWFQKTTLPVKHFWSTLCWKHVEIPAPEINLCFTPRPQVAGENFLCVQVWVKSCCHGGCHVLSYKDRKSSSYTHHVLFVSHVCTWKLFVWKRKKKIKKQTDKTKQINQGHPTIENIVQNHLNIAYWTYFSI